MFVETIWSTPVERPVPSPQAAQHLCLDIYSREGAAMLSGHNAARYTDERRLTHIADFWSA